MSIWSLSVSLVELFLEEPIWSCDEDDFITIIKNEMNTDNARWLASLFDSKVPGTILLKIDEGQGCNHKWASTR